MKIPNDVYSVEFSPKQQVPLLRDIAEVDYDKLVELSLLSNALMRT